MLDALERYYREQGILSTSFTCPHMDDCSSGAGKFTGPKSAGVGTRYGRRDLPRLLFLSLDSGWGDDDPKKRLPEAVRPDNTDVGTLKRGRHWYRTIELAWYILRRFDAELCLDDAKQYFAHANSAKCCQHKSGGRQADGRLFDNCRKYLPGELRVLRPDILVTQGVWARKAIESLYGPGEPIREDEFAKRVEMDDRSVFWLHTHHPRSGKHFGRQIDLERKLSFKDPNRCRGWNRYGDIIADWWKKEHGDLNR